MKYVLKMMLSFVLLLSLFVPATQTEASSKFKDTNNHWARTEIEFLTNKGIISGFSDGTFKPNASVTRGQTAILLARALNLNVNNRPNPRFKDVPVTHSAYKYIAAIVDEGIYPKGTNFYPNKPLTREEMARMLVNAYSLKGNKNITFKDVSTSYWAQPYISLLAENGITAGYSNGTFKPKDTVTRAQFSVFLSRCLDDRFKVAPPSPGQTAPVLMKDIKLGMTYQQVKNRETRPLILGDHDGHLGILIYSVEKYGYYAHLEYLFENNKLIFATYNFIPEEDSYHTRSELAGIHSELHRGGVKEFGHDFFYYDEEYPSNRFVTHWQKSGYDALLSVNDDNVHSQAVIIHTEPLYTSAATSQSSYADVLINKREELKAALKK
ncbi:S-layer homology domain-containing protein [Bacillus sp. REN10]|uniref:S-layer homology domain-containing protein n=1 Tax=Bacillus sp. REN10 TaxID=2782541 RepID=UPI00193B20F2|nr:S-layer homology domain-containing protein [Bacillus sp. REN10]